MNFDGFFVNLHGFSLFVIDFLDFYVAGKHWPAFNVADSMIFIGAGLMIIDSFKNKELIDVNKKSK